jgi:tripartite-type tricarboxylate transporter receptor subunit TctC
MNTDLECVPLRRALLVSVGLACLSRWGSARAQGPLLKLVVGSPPGALGDVVARLVADRMRATTGSPVVVDNKAGASGLIAAELVARSAGDGATLLVAPDNVMVVNPLIHRKLRYSPERDFRAVGVLGKATLVLVANPRLGLARMPDLLAAARAQPESLVYASGGAGHVTHIGVELMCAKLDIRLRHVPYKGTSPALAAVVGGECHLMLLGLSGALPLIKAGKLVALAASGPASKEHFPHLPSLKELHEDLDISVWFGIFAPAQTPSETVQKLNGIVNAILAQKEVVQRFSDYGMTTQPGSPAELEALVKSDTLRFAPIVKALNLSLE